MGVEPREQQLFVPQSFPGVHQSLGPQFANVHNGNNNNNNNNNNNTNTTDGTRLAHPVEVSGQWLLIDLIASQVLPCLRALGWAGCCQRSSFLTCLRAYVLMSAWLEQVSGEMGLSS